MAATNTTLQLHAGRVWQRLEVILLDMYRKLVEESQRLNIRFKKNWPSSLLGLQQNEEPYYTMKEARELRRRREEDAVGHLESEEDPDDPDEENFIF